MDEKKLIQGMRLILEGLSENPDREGIQQTPQRFARMCAEIFAGYTDAEPVVNLFESPTEDTIIVVRNIPFYSMCEHHFLPFFGEMHLAYLPSNRRVTGFSDIVQVARYFSSRLQIQERLTLQVASFLHERLKSTGLLLISHATQLCMSMRGVKSQNTRTEVIIPCGIFRDSPEKRAEAMRLLMHSS